MSTKAELYEQDFYRWTQEQATRLDARQFDALDIPHLVEEITSLGKTVKTQRLDVAKVLRDNPSLRAAVPAELADAYAIARVEAAAALEVEEDTVPSECPWTAAQVLDYDFFPAP